MILEQYGPGFILKTKKKIACGLDRTDKEWEPAAPLSILVQSDWDFPPLAINLGFNPCCNKTDGTIDCPEHGTLTSDMIHKAFDFLMKNTGENTGKKAQFLYDTYEAVMEWG